MIGVARDGGPPKLRNRKTRNDQTLRRNPVNFMHNSRYAKQREAVRLCARARFRYDGEADGRGILLCRA